MIAVIGCGRVGLPLALFLANKGLPTIGVDTNPEKINMIKKGKMPFQENGATLLLQKALERGLFLITSNLAEALEKADIYIITIGTSLNNYLVPDQEPVTDIIRKILPFSHEKQVTIILRSTVSPGTSQYIQHELKKENITIGKDVLYAYCPERIAEGKALEELGKQPQIIGTFDNISQEKVEMFFRSLGINCIIGNPVEAELAKIFNNMYRYVNFALANQCMYLAEKNGASTPAVLRMCSEGYERGGPWKPGYAAGPCLAKDGFFLTNQLLFIDLIFSSWKINESLPEVLLKEAESIRPLKKAVLLGLAFKAGSDDSRNSLGLKLFQLLKGRGINTTVHDPYLPFPGKASTLQEALNRASEIFVMVPHNEYKELSISELLRYTTPQPLIVDPWFLWSNRVITIHDSAPLN